MKFVRARFEGLNRAIEDPKIINFLNRVEMSKALPLNEAIPVSNEKLVLLMKKLL